MIKVLCSLFYSQARLPAAVRENEPANPGDGGNRAYSTRVKSYYILRGGGGGGEANHSNLEWLLQARLISHFYRISKIVRALWLAERRVCMGVCKHGWDVKMFCFSHATQASTNLKTFSSWKLHKFTLFTHSLVGWNLENLSKTCFVNFFRLSWHFKREKSVLWKTSFLQNKELITRARRCVVYTTSRLVRISLLISAITKSFAFLSRES